MKKSKSSKRWLKEHFSDPYVKKARQDGVRARSVYKLKEIQERYRIIKSGMHVVDLGAAPGGWSEYAVQVVGVKGKIFALDILPMRSIGRVEFLQGDFTQEEVVDELHALLGEDKVDVVLSDMAPNFTGVRAVDQARSMNLAQAGLDFAQKVLKPGGTFLTKVFQGAEFDDFLKMLRHNFGEVKVVKPDASRARSKEVFLLSSNFK